MDRRKKGISRRSLLLGAGASVALAATAQPTQALTISRRASEGPEEPGQRADLAEQAIVRRHVRSLWGHPGLRLGVLAWPASLFDRSLVRWCYWWQAQLLDCAIDAAYRDRTPERVERVAALARGIRTRNVTGWTNRYYDDMAWLALALERADRLLGVGFPDAVADLRVALLDGWNPAVGAVPWRSGDDFYNTPAIGPTGLALARFGDPTRARQLADFLHTRLRDTGSGLILDGVHEPGGDVDRSLTTYSQGITLGLEAELAVRTGESGHHSRAAALVAATGSRLTNAGVIAGAAGDDSGLFMGILARYLAEVAVTLGDTAAATLVHTSARAAWEHRAEVDGLPLFGMDWSRPVTVRHNPAMFPRLIPASPAASTNLSPDLSVQLSGWMLLEADYRVTAAGL
ncbi:putative alpha-1,6-mannanase (GH76 family) [Nocardia transvalensis]|uniref:Putative alpha-1,6-mannanase (GH76 family) n=1 Tax=Nocardia transvalensis TaxID=37333 RepID=A0A7W9UM29_9NOCA|nr:glycoside hydrolase family 76 protein [Nocardia transvalensis]MBB5917340.1 putative alpha-1,6-mannanase (GH76 family) [Nocardia transvalensis]